jgi:hypothetical protein
VAAFCREREVCAPQFFAWRKRLREAGAAQFAEVKMEAAGPEASAAHGAAIELRGAGPAFRQHKTTQGGRQSDRVPDSGEMSRRSAL